MGRNPLSGVLLLLVIPLFGCPPPLARTDGTDPTRPSPAGDGSLRFPDGGPTELSTISVEDGAPDHGLLPPPDSSIPPVSPDAQTPAQPDAAGGDVTPVEPDAATSDAGAPLPDMTPAPDTDPPQPDLLQPDTTVHGWYQANSIHCPTFCANQGLSNAPSPDGAYCMSGEVRPASGIVQGISFTYGCWPSCSPSSTQKATSHGKYCYLPGQKQDNDGTDLTVGCFCAE